MPSSSAKGSSRSRASASGLPVTGKETDVMVWPPCCGPGSDGAVGVFDPSREAQRVDVEVGEGGDGPVLLIGLVAQHQPEKGAAIDHRPERVGRVAGVDLGP